MPNLTLEQILNRTEVIKYSKKYKYIEQRGINGKPTLVSGDENLKIYPLKIKLHHSFCNPQNIIDEIERKAQNRDVINYFQNGKYIGDYVISDFNVNIIQKTDNAVLMAEIQINLLEKNNPVSDFLRQISDASSKNLMTSNLMKNFLIYAEEKIIENIFTSTKTKFQTNSNLSNSGNSVLSKVSTNIIDNIQKQGISNSKQIVSNYTRSLNLTPDEEKIIKQELEKIPKMIAQAAIRQRE